MTASAFSIPRRRGRMGAYALWQGRDFLWNTAIISLILFGLLGSISIMQIHMMDRSALARMPAGGGMPTAAKVQIFLQVYGIFTTVGPIIALSGIVSQDRTLGYTRFLFSKPISPRLFYLQSFAIRLAGFLALGHILLFAYGRYAPPAYTARFLVDLTIAFIATGGIVFVLSVLSRYDGLIAVVLFLVSAIAWSTWEKVGGLKHALTYLFPPVEKFGEIHQWTVGLNSQGSLTSVEFPSKWALWGVGYGLACLVLGLYLLRRIPLTKA